MSGNVYSPSSDWFFERIPFDGFKFSDFEYENDEKGINHSAESTTDEVPLSPTPLASFHFVSAPTPLGSVHSASASASTYCSDEHSTALIVLFAMGLIASILGIVDAALHCKKIRQNHSFLHLFTANFIMVFFLLLITAGSKHGSLHDGDILHKILTFLANVGENVFAFQLTFLTALRLRELKLNKKFPTSRCTKVSCCLLWLIAMLLSALTVLKDLMHAGETEKETAVLDTYANVFITVKVLFGFILPCVVALFCFTMVFYQRKMQISTQRETGEIIRGVKEVASLYAVFAVCVLPYHAYQLHSTTETELMDCTNLSDMLMCFVALSSMLIPLLHFANMQFVERNWEIKFSPVYQKAKKSSEATTCVFVVSDEQRKEERAI